MGFRGAIRRGGGFLNGVTGTIVDTKVETFESKKGEDMISFRLFVKLDGADAPIDTSLFFGSAEGYVVSDDERSISAEDDSPVRIGASTGLGIFMSSLLDISPEIEERLPDVDGGEPLTLTGLHGLRLEFRQQVNDEATKARGKRKSKKNGREYPQTDLVVERVLDIPAAGKAGKAAKSMAGKPAAAKPNGKAATTPAEDVAELGASTLMDILGDQDEGSIKVAKLRMAAITKLGPKHPQRSEIVNYLTNVENLVGIEGVEVDQKAGTVALV